MVRGENFTTLRVQNNISDNGSQKIAFIKMDQEGRFILKPTLLEVKTENIDFSSNKNQKLLSKNGNLEILSEKGYITLRNGLLLKENNEINLLYKFKDPDVDYETNYTIEIYKKDEDVFNLRSNSLLVESLKDNTPLTLYSNSGINNICHNSIKNITDEDFFVQASRNINLTSLGFITFNSERLITSVSEDISLISETGDIEIGRHGITANPILKVNNNNFISVNKEDDPTRLLELEVNEKSIDNGLKNGLKISSKSFFGITNSEELSKNDRINPEIQLENIYTSNKLNMGLGKNEKENQHRIVAKKIILNQKHYLKSLNSLNFDKSDIGNLIDWNNSDLPQNKIISLVDHNEHGLIAEINLDSINESDFGYQVGYINRNKFGYLRTENNSNLHLGTNNKNILTLSNTGNIGINNEFPESSLEVSNNYGKFIFNNIEKNKIYFKSKIIQFNNGNYLLISNTKKNKNYSLEGFIYNNNFQLIKNFIILKESEIEIEYDIDNLQMESNFLKYDHCIIIFSYKNKTNVFFTERLILQSNGNTFKKKRQIKNIIQKSSNPVVKSFYFPSIELNGYIICYKEINTLGGLEHNYVEIYKNLEDDNLIENPFNITADLYSSNKFDNITLQNINFNEVGITSIEIDNKNNSFLFSNFHKINYAGDLTNKSNQTFLQLFNLSLTSQTGLFSLERKQIKNKNTFSLSINNDIEGANIKKIKEDGNKLFYVASYYKYNDNKEKISPYYFKFDLTNDTFNNNSENQLQDEWEIISNNDYLMRTPSIDIRNDIEKFIISWTKIGENREIIYKEDGITSLNFVNSNYLSDSFLLTVNNSKQRYQETILIADYKSNNTDDIYNNSVIITSILSSSNLLNIENKFSNLVISDTGKINLNNNLEIYGDKNEIDENKNRVKVLGNLIISENTGIQTNTEGEQGQLNYYDNNLYIYLNNQWKQITT